MTKALVIGAGPAGLMAAETLARAGSAVTVIDAMPSVGRKFLMAGKSGLNLTNTKPFDDFVAAYDPVARLRPIIAAFGPDAVRDWAEELDQPTFEGSSGYIFPKVMKASPLLRAWLGHLAGLGVTIRPRCRWTGPLPETGQCWTVSTADGTEQLHADVAVLALGGASWKRLGADGAWAAPFRGAGVAMTAFAGSNQGFHVDWSAYMAPVLGHPVKPVALMAGGQRIRGEIILTRKGIEGSGIYAVSRALRGGAELQIDLLPDLAAGDVQERLARPVGKATKTNFLRKAFGFDKAKLALINECGGVREKPLAQLPLKALPIPITGPFPMDEAISTAGGVSWDSLTTDLELKTHPGIFCAGEMLDWDAPTGGYLLTACLATGLWAGRAAAERARPEN